MLGVFQFAVLTQFESVSASAVVCHFGIFQRGSTAVHYAAKDGVKEVLAYLVEKGASLNAQTNVSMNSKERTGFRISMRWQKNR